MTKNIVLIQPKDGVYNKFHAWVPLSLLAISSRLIREGYQCHIIDQRHDPSWAGALRRALKENPEVVGITSRTGSQILFGLEAARIVKSSSSCPVIWGGVHATLFSSQTLDHPLIDIVVRGEGEDTFYEVVKALENRSRLEDIRGISYRENGGKHQTPDRPRARMDDLPDMPYEIVDLGPYLHRLFGEEGVIEVETSRGCPYSCAFCYNPLSFHRQWRAMSQEKVLGILKMLVGRRGIRTFHIIDDSFFVDRNRTRQIMEGVLRDGLDIRFGFQGATVRDLLRMGPDELSLLERAGCRFLQFGVESGSPRVLRLINKDIQVEEVMELNRRMRDYPTIIPYYNFIVGFPTETAEEVLMTARLAWRLLEENPMALVSPFHHYKAYPGTPLFDLSRQNHCDVPSTLEGWGAYDWTNAMTGGGSRSYAGFLKNVEVSSIFVDRKIDLVSTSRFYRMMARAYRPVARFRMKRSFYSFMPEARAFHWAVS